MIAERATRHRGSARREPAGTRWEHRAAAWLIRSGWASRLEERDGRRPNVLRILAYHRVANPGADPGLDPTLRSASPAQFIEQMTYLATRYRVLSLEEVLWALTSPGDLPPRSVLITFDDGYRDFAEKAWPVLRRLGLPAVLFVATDYLSDRRSYWWDRLCTACLSTERTELAVVGIGQWSLRSLDERFQTFLELKRTVAELEHMNAIAVVDEVVDTLGADGRAPGAELLTWQDLRRLSSLGLYVGAHTRSHPILSRISLDAARTEIAGSQEDLRRELGRAWPAFAYPSGHSADISPALLELLDTAGFALATTMIEGHNRLGCQHPLRLRRIGMAPHLSLDEFRLVLTSAYDCYGALARIRDVRPRARPFVQAHDGRP